MEIQKGLTALKVLDSLNLIKVQQRNLIQTAQAGKTLPCQMKGYLASMLRHLIMPTVMEPLLILELYLQ